MENNGEEKEIYAFYCPKCGALVDDSLSECPECGFPLGRIITLLDRQRMKESGVVHQKLYKAGRGQKHYWSWCQEHLSPEVYKSFWDEYNSDLTKYNHTSQWWSSRRKALARLVWHHKPVAFPDIDLASKKRNR